MMMVNIQPSAMFRQLLRPYYGTQNRDNFLHKILGLVMMMTIRNTMELLKSTAHLNSLD